MIKFDNEARRKMTNMLAEEQLTIDELNRERVELRKKLEALERKNRCGDRSPGCDHGFLWNLS